jgi:hypothetical protein
VAKIDELTCGSIVVKGKNYCQYVLLFADGTVKNRKGGLNELAEQKKKVAALIHATC